MSLGHLTLKAMLITGVLLTPSVAPLVRADALSDLQDLQMNINSAATSIGTKTNSSRNWGFFGADPKEAGTADLVSNISTTILRVKFQADTNLTSWVNATNATNIGQNLTNLDDPYINYVSAIPNLATALTALGRSWHKEMNRPVYEAIDALQQTITAFQTSMLTDNLIHTNSTLRTIRASGALEDAQTAWSRLLNFPGSSGKSSSRRRRRTFDSRLEGLVKATFDPNDRDTSLPEKRSASWRPTLHQGEHYTHQDLWDRTPSSRQSREGMARPYDAEVQDNERLAAIRKEMGINNLPKPKFAGPVVKLRPSRRFDALPSAPTVPVAKPAAVPTCHPKNRCETVAVDFVA
ncbi:hypothetical protein BDV96DRAFT_336677 [Lophiotrema nucula]|uniref:Uncharacterized protein n=1 Tax=Lophiotrema nucula TaxID=690887 RepID=A0A6A5YJI6_9PLEO|nr:hypothetical protein BDV96DRAFT_336677 [Lophiotrema nucula]